METITSAQQEFIDQVNHCSRPRDRMHRVRRAANRKLTEKLEKFGLTADQIRYALIDAWDVANLEYNA